MPAARTTDGVEIAYRTAGQGPPDVLLMHGWAGSGAYFDELLRHLDLSQMRAITFDYRGHGDSGRNGAYGLDELTADVLAVADDAGVDRCVLVGFSMSAKFAQYVAGRHPARVLGQVLIAGCPVGELSLPAELVADWYGRAGDAARMIEIARSCITQPVEEELLDAFGRDAARVPLETLQGTMEAVTTTSFAPPSVPTLVVGGATDWMFPPDVLRDGVAGAIHGARLELLDCCHEIPTELPVELAALIAGFVGEVASDERAAGGVSGV
jgi:pimeloyl-ACP methyl ester carboxylesterase